MKSPIPIIEEQIVLDVHLAANGYECKNPDCICHVDQYEQAFGQLTSAELDQSGTHAPDCRCSWCEP